MILFDETIRQATRTAPRSRNCCGQGRHPGHQGRHGRQGAGRLPGREGDRGSRRLRDRLAEYYELGARFTKWRAVITIDDGIPPSACIEANAHALARYAALCQEAGLVPIVEPEVLMDGDHTIERYEAVTTRALASLFAALYAAGRAARGHAPEAQHGALGQHCPGAGRRRRRSRTRRCARLRRTVPAAVPGIAFLSGGQTPAQATAQPQRHERAGRRTRGSCSFSYGRALQQPRAPGVAGPRGQCRRPPSRRSTTAPGSTALRASASTFRRTWSRLARPAGRSIDRCIWRPCGRSIPTAGGIVPRAPARGIMRVPANG